MQTRVLVLGGVALAASVWLVVDLRNAPPVRYSGQDVWRVANGGDSVPRSIDEAEAIGRAYPRVERKELFPPIIASMPHVGDSSRHCVNVGMSNVARSGEFFAGPFVLYAETWRPGPGNVKFWWQAAHKLPAGVPSGLTLRIVRLDTIADAYVFISATETRNRISHVFPHGWGRGTHGVDLPSRGKWLMVASVASDWGCFVYNLT